MEFFIRKNATLPYIKVKVFKSGRNDYKEFSDSLTASTITFSMYDEETEIYKILDRPASIMSDGNTPPNYYVYYQFRKTDSKREGRYVGEFKITNSQGEIKLPLRDKLYITVSDSFADSDTCCRPNRGDAPIVFPTETPRNTVTPTVSLSNTPTPSVTSSQTPTNTSTPNSTPTPTNTSTPNSTPTPTNTSTPSFTPTPTNTVTPTNTQTSTPTPSVTNTVTPTNTQTSTPTPSVTNTVTPTNTPTNTPSQTATNTPTNTPSTSVGATPNPTTTTTPTPSVTNTVTPTSTQTSTPTPSVTNTQTSTPTPSVTPTNTPTDTPSQTATNTPTVTPTPSFTPTNTPTPTSTGGPITAFCFNLVQSPYEVPSSGNTIISNNNGGGVIGSLNPNSLSGGTQPDGIYWNAIDVNGIDRTDYFSGFTGQSVTITISQTGSTAIYSGNTGSGGGYTFGTWTYGTDNGFYFRDGGTSLPGVEAVLIQSASTQWVSGQTVCISATINVPPTPTPTPTSTPTNTPTNTPTPSFTPTNTVTPTHTPTVTPSPTQAIVPSDPSLEIYYDASDTANFVGVTSSGDTFTQWSDSSATAHNANPIGGTSTRPAWWSNVVCGLGGVKFDGTSDGLSVNPFTDIANISGFTAIILGKLTNTGTTQQLITSGIGSASVNNSNIRVSGGTFVLGAANGLAETSQIADTDPHMWTMVFDGSGSTNSDRLKFYVDGVQESLTFLSNVGTVTDSSIDRLYIGIDRVGVSTYQYYYSGFMFEVLLWSRVLPPSELSAVHSYLDNKWYSCIVPPTPTPTNTPTSTITPTPSITVTPTNTITPTNSVTPTPSITPTNTITPTPTQSVTPTITPSTSPPVDWSPTDVNVVAWIDASDTGSYTTSSSTLTSVTDKAGTYTMSVGNTPTVVTNGLNSLNVFDFDGSGEYLQSTSYSSQTDGSGNHWAVGVFLADFVDGDKDSFWSYETNTSTSTKRDYAISSGGGGSNTWPGELDLDTNNVTNRISSTIGNLENWTLQSVSIDNWVIVSCWFNKTGNQIGNRVNGSNAFTPVNDYDNSIQTNQELRLMRNRSSEELDGRLAEFFAVADIPGIGGTDLTDLEKAEGYLACKWGLQSLLPSGHPYKTSCPTQ